MSIAVVQISQANLDHHHLYLAKIMDLFPSSSIGGSSIATRASRLIKLYPRGGEPVVTDIAGDKKIFRQRAWVRKFFTAHKLKAGDRVFIEISAPDEFQVYPGR